MRADWQATVSGETPTVDEEEIAQVVAMWTGIPVTRIAQEESERLLQMEEALHQRLIGQEEAIETVSKAVRRARAGLKDPKRPIGSFIFLGPTGVGKTELAKALAEFMFGSEDALIKIDMSEFMERHNVSRLVGAPPGYVGFDEGGQLTEAVRRKSYAVILLDEVEKAHPEVFNILLQILEDGHLTDAKGRRVDFRNTIIIMTSNLGAAKIQTNSSLGFRVQGDTVETRAAASYDLMKEKVQTELKASFRPEFLNRIDATVVFRSLTVEEITKIVDLMLKRVRDQLTAQGMALEITQAAKEHIIKLGYDAAYGARPLRRMIQNLIEDPLAEHLLLGRYDARRLDPRGPGPGRQGPVHRGHRGKDPGRSRLAAARSEARGSRPESLRLPVLRGRGPALGGPVPDLRRMEHPGRDRRPRRAAPGGVGRWQLRSHACVARLPDGRAGRGAPTGRDRGAGSGPGRRPRSRFRRAAGRGARDRQVHARCSRSRPAWAAGAPGDRRPVRDGRGIDQPGQAPGGAHGADLGAPSERRSAWLRRRRSAGSWSWPARSGPAC